MTPEEEWAGRLLEEFRADRDHMTSGDTDEMFTSYFRSAIRSAVEAEREACAHICDVMGQDVVGQWFGNEDFRRGANRCAHLIRNQLTVAATAQEISPKSPDQGA